MSTESFTIRLVYFKPSGKYYSEGTYKTEKLYMFDVFNEVRTMQKEHKLPGLITDGSGFIVLVDADKHPNGYPGLIVNPNLIIPD